jgi:catechol 2,3-dioxygenase-like lactoylglutathione lyase family enzyme
MIRTHGLTHVALAVADPQRSARFYRDVFGAVTVFDNGDFVQAQTPGSRDVLVFERAAGRARQQVGKSGGIAHFGFRLVDPGDIAAAAKAVVDAGGRVTDRGEFCPGEPYLFATDPDGYALEIWYEIPTPVDPEP